MLAGSGRRRNPGSVNLRSDQMECWAHRHVCVAMVYGFPGGDLSVLFGPLVELRLSEHVPDRISISEVSG